MGWTNTCDPTKTGRVGGRGKSAAPPRAREPLRGGGTVGRGVGGVGRRRTAWRKKVSRRVHRRRRPISEDARSGGTSVFYAAAGRGQRANELAPLSSA